MAKRLSLPLLAFLCLSWTAVASEDTDSLSEELRTFMQSPEAEFAPATAAKAQAFLGAVMMAERGNDEDSAKQGLQAANETLNEARRLAASFQEKYGDLLKIRSAAHETLGADARLQRADALLAKLIKTLEDGKLNEAEQLRLKASGTYRGLILDGLPRLVEQTGEALTSAARARAKKYAPVTYQRAEAWYVTAKSYLAGEGAKMPAHPRAGLELAVQAREMALKVKKWRSQTDSHEALVLQARKDRASIARSLGMAAADKITADISAAALVAIIQKQQEEQVRLEAEHRAEISRLKMAATTQLADLQGRQRQELLSQHEDQMGQLKEAFQIKLERERQTLQAQLASEREVFSSKLEHETKGQKQLELMQEKFLAGEIDIFPNLDGSILIRLKTLNFASGSSTVNTVSYDLLARLKTALEVFGQRQVSIEGHTDNAGDAKANQRLSLTRAESVRDFLIAAGMPAGRLTSIGFGEAHPIASNDYDKGRAMNRRIDVIIHAPKQ
ncbi:MAG: OmpA family protein [Mariprofundaceae bacterium]